MCRYNHRPFDLITHHVMLVRYSLILPIRLGNSSRFVTSVFIAKCHDEGSVVSGGGVFFFTTGLGLMILASFCSWTSDEVVFLFRTSGPSRSTTKPRSRKLYIGLACHCAEISCRSLAGGEGVTGVRDAERQKGSVEPPPLNSAPECIYHVPLLLMLTPLPEPHGAPIPSESRFPGVARKISPGKLHRLVIVLGMNWAPKQIWK